MFRFARHEMAGGGGDGGSPSRAWREELRNPCLWLVLAIGLVVFCPGLDTTRLWDEDEGYFAGAAAEMYVRGDWIVPYFNGELFGHKPVWMYWMMMLGYGLFGIGELGARCFSAVFALASVLLTYRLGTDVLNRRVGFLAAIILSTSLMFTVVGRAATPDGFLVLFSTLALYVFAAHGFAAPMRAGAVVDHGDARVRLPRKWTSFAGMYVAMGFGTLTKGPIGFLFPMAVIGLFLLCTTPRRPTGRDASTWRHCVEALRPFGPVNFLHTVWLMRPLTAVLVILAVAGPWYVAVGVQTGGDFLREFFGVHHFHRATVSMENHGGSLFYYVLSMAVGAFPWSVFLVPALLVWTHLWRRHAEHHFALTLIVCWIGVYVGVFSLAATKLPNYILPAYPAVALFFAFSLDAWLARPELVGAGWRRAAFGIIAAAGVGMLSAIPVLSLFEFGGQTLLDRMGLVKGVQSEVSWLGLLGLPSAVGGLVALVLAEHRRLGAAIGTVCVTALVTVVGLWNVAAPWVDQFQASQEIVQHIHRDFRGAPHAVAAYRFFRPSMVFYSGGPVRRFWKPEDVQRFFADNEAGFLITESSKLAELGPALPQDVIVVARRARFPEKGELTLLARRPNRIAAGRPADMR